MSLPGVAELLRPVGPGPASDSGRQASGREAHPQKITVYLSADEFLDLERARLTLLAHGIGVDRGRLVREAIAVLMMDLEAGIDASVIARRLGAPGRPGPASGVLANRANGALAVGAFAKGGPHHGALPGDGALTGGALDNCGPVAGVKAHGVQADGDPVTGGLAHGVQADAGPVADALGDDGLVAGALADGDLVAGAPAVAQ